MFVIRRNQVIVTALAVMIAVAGYLNYTESRVSEVASNNTVITVDDTLSDTTALIPEGDITTIADDLPDSELVNADSLSFDPITAEADTTDDTGSAIFVNATAGDSTYFVQAKLEREQARSKQRDILTEMINNTELDQEQRAVFAESMLDIQKRIEKETAAEAMIRSKGFGDAYVRIDDETVDVVVDAKELTDAQVAQIEDIVKRKTGFSQDKIRISTLKTTS